MIFRIELEKTHAESTSDYAAATMVKKPVETKPVAKQPLEPVPDSDESSD